MMNTRYDVFCTILSVLSVRSASTLPVGEWPRQSEESLFLWQQS